MDMYMGVKTQPYLHWAFGNLKRRREGNSPPPNLTVSSQMTMKHGRDILWIEIFTN